jgi:hypothetical protein
MSEPGRDLDFEGDAPPFGDGEPLFGEVHMLGVVEDLYAVVRAGVRHRRYLEPAVTDLDVGVGLSVEPTTVSAAERWEDLLVMMARLQVRRDRKQ